LGDDLGGFGGDEATLLQTADVLAHRVLAHTHRLPNRFDAGPALMRLSVLAPFQETVHRQLAIVQSQLEQFIGQREKISASTVLAVPHTPPPVCSFTHWMNCSLGTTIRLPTRSIGKPGSCINSYPDDGEMQSTFATV